MFFVSSNNTIFEHSNYIIYTPHSTHPIIGFAPSDTGTGSCSLFKTDFFFCSSSITSAELTWQTGLGSGRLLMTPSKELSFCSTISSMPLMGFLLTEGPAPGVSSKEPPISSIPVSTAPLTSSHFLNF